MTVTLSKVLVLAAVIVAAITSFLAFAIDSRNPLHMMGGIALSIALYAAASLVP